MWGAIAQAAASTAGTAFSLYEQHKNRKFQESLAHNGVQWRVADMKKAGINPILAASPGGGASTVGSTMPDVSGMNNFGSQSSAVSQAKTAKSQAESNIALQGAQALNVAADTVNKNSSNELIKQQALTETARRNMMLSQSGLYSASAVRERYKSELDKADAEFYRSDYGKAQAAGNQIAKQGKYGAAAGVTRYGMDAAAKAAKNSANSAGAVKKQSSYGNGYQYSDSY